MKSGNECRDGLSLHAGTWTVSVLLLGNLLCRGLRAKRGPDCNAVVVGGFFTLWNHSVALVCSEVSQRLFKVALQFIKYFKSNICLEMGKKFTIKFDLHCFIFQPEKFIVVTTCTDYGNNSFVCFFDKINVFPNKLESS